MSKGFGYVVEFKVALDMFEERHQELADLLQTEERSTLTRHEGFGYWIRYVDAVALGHYVLSDVIPVHIGPNAKSKVKWALRDLERTDLLEWDDDE